VAATKTFVTQVVAFQLFALRLAELRGVLAGDELTALIREVKRLPHLISTTLDGSGAQLERIAGDVSDRKFFMYLGRNACLPIALEGRSNSRRSPTSRPMPTRPAR